MVAGFRVCIAAAIACALEVTGTAGCTAITGLDDLETSPCLADCGTPGPGTDSGRPGSDAGAPSSGDDPPIDPGSVVQVDGEPPDDAPAFADVLAPADSSMSSDATAPPSIALVQSGRSHGQSVVSTITLNPTTSGNLLVVGVDQDSDSSGAVLGITDDAPNGPNTYVSANARSSDPSCTDTAEIWYAMGIRPGATTVTVTMTSSLLHEVWVAEFSGLSKTAPLDKVAVANAQPASNLLSAPKVSPSAPIALVVSLGTDCADISGLQSGNPFTDLPPQNGETLAYYFSVALGSYGAVWVQSNGTWNASTASFK